MLIDILKMPPVLGIPIHRQKTVLPNSEIVNTIINYVGVSPNQMFHHRQLLVGSVIRRQPANLYKAIHVSPDNRWVFETIFSVENNQLNVCLYSKIISSFDTKIAISVKTIGFYTPSNFNLTAIPYLIDVSPPSHNAITDNLVPPIFGEKSLKKHIYHLLDIRVEGFLQNHLGFGYKPLYEHVPSVMDALVEGYFKRSPLGEIPVQHPLLQISKDKWFKHEELLHAKKALRVETYVNHKEFDSTALALVSMNSCKLNVTCLMAHALDGITEVYLTRDYVDYYQHYLRGMHFDNNLYKENLSNIFYRCALIYCNLYQIDANIFLSRPMDQSSVTVSKNIYDETMVTVHDVIHDRYVCFYSSFPALALATLSVGNYQ